MKPAEDTPDFFARNIGSISTSQQLRLQEATVSIIGCGGLGGFVIEEIARLGVGSLRICDPDKFSTSNINRQLYALAAIIGQYKTEVAAERIRSMHGQTEVLSLTTRFQEAADDLFPATEVVVDCLDTPNSRRELAELCNQNKIPLVHGAVHQWYGQVGVQLAGGTLIQTLYGTHAEDETRIPSVLSCTVAVVASIQAAETCKLLLGMDSPLHNSWMNIDLRRVTVDIIESPGG
jgi:molybdopterin/thiamine biosynthesis adenylyltransferase